MYFTNVIVTLTRKRQAASKQDASVQLNSLELGNNPMRVHLFHPMHLFRLHSSTMLVAIIHSLIACTHNTVDTADPTQLNHSIDCCVFPGHREFTKTWYLAHPRLVDAPAAGHLLSFLGCMFCSIQKKQGIQPGCHGCLVFNQSGHSTL